MTQAYLRVNKSINDILAERAVSVALAVLFAASLIVFLLVKRRSPGYAAGLFLASFIVLNYLALGILADHPANRYKLPFWWIQGPLLVSFLMSFVSVVKRGARDRP